jgi:hypothetical protein
MELISQREFARRVGVSEGMIRKAVDNGWIIQGCTKRPSGLPAIAYETALAEWNASPGGIKSAAKNINTPADVKTKPLDTKPPAASDQRAPLLDPAISADKKQIIEDKKFSTRLQLQRQALELQKAQGKLIDKEATEKQLFEFGQSITENLMTLPNRIVDLIRSAADRHTAVTIFTNELKQALRALAQPPDLSKY